MAKTKSVRRPALPAHVRIAGSNWRVVRTVLEPHVAGLCDQRHHTIYLNNHPQAADEATDTLLHEILHALEHTGGLPTRENHVRHFATGLIQVLRDNPSLVERLLHG